MRVNVCVHEIERGEVNRKHSRGGGGGGGGVLFGDDKAALHAPCVTYVTLCQAHATN